MILKLTAQWGDDLREAIVKSIAIAKSLDLTVELDFNGIKLLIKENINPDRLYIKYYDRCYHESR